MHYRPTKTYNNHTTIRRQQEIEITIITITITYNNKKACHLKKNNVCFDNFINICLVFVHIINLDTATTSVNTAHQLLWQYCNPWRPPPVSYRRLSKVKASPDNDGESSCQPIRHRQHRVPSLSSDVPLTQTTHQLFLYVYTYLLSICASRNKLYSLLLWTNIIVKVFSLQMCGFLL